MNKSDVVKTLTIAAGFDNRRVDDVMTAAWLELLGDFTFEQCRAAVLDHYRDPKTRHQYLTAAHVLDRVEAYARAQSGDVETDVRSAKARGLIGQEWPKRKPLPADVALSLQTARDRDRAEAARYAEIEQ